MGTPSACMAQLFPLWVVDRWEERDVAFLCFQPMALEVRPKGQWDKGRTQARKGDWLRTAMSLEAAGGSRHPARPPRMWHFYPSSRWHWKSGQKASETRSERRRERAIGYII